MDKYEQFFYDLSGDVVAQTKCYNLPASVCLAQMALESSWGDAIIGNYNYFGRKWGGWGDYVELPTQECYDGVWQTIYAKFQSYGSLIEAVDDWCVLITQEPCYANAWNTWTNTHDLEQFIRALAATYATDPDYADKIISTINCNGLTAYDEV